MWVFQSKHAFKKNITLGVIALTTCLAGCASAVFQSLNDYGAPGVQYHLPTTMLKVTITPIGYKSGTTDIVAALSDTQIAQAKKSTHIETDVILNGKEYLALVDQTGKLASDLITDLHLTTDTSNIADAVTSYTLKYEPSILAHDRVCVGVSKTGLLDYAEAKVKDQTPKLLAHIAKLVGQVTGPVPLGTTPQVDGSVGETLELHIDPLNESDWRRVEQAIGARYPQFRGKITFRVPDIEYFSHSSVSGHTCKIGSLCYRTKAPLRIEMRNARTGSITMSYPKVINKAVVHNIDINRAMFIEKATHLDFQEGVLKSVKIKKPSEALEAAKLPSTIWNAVVLSAFASPANFDSNFIPGQTAKDYGSVIDNINSNFSNIERIKAKLDTIQTQGLSATEVNSKIVGFKSACKFNTDKQ